MQQPTPPRPATGRLATITSGHAPLLLALLVFLASLFVTASLYSNARRTALAQLENGFTFRARDMAYSIEHRMAVYEQVLRGARGFLRGSVEIDRKAFADYFRLLGLEEHFPGIEALAVSVLVPQAQLAGHEAKVRAEGFPDYTVHPAGARDPYTSIAYIEPFGGRNLRAFGYDMYSEPVRRAAMAAARDSGGAALSGKVRLVQEDDVDPQPGFLMYLPVYRAGMPNATVQQRRAALVGWVYSPFRMKDLMQGVGGRHTGDLDISIYDGPAAREDALLYRSAPALRVESPLFQSAHRLTPAGRNWTIVIRSTPALDEMLDTTRPASMLFSGVGLGFLASLIVWLLATERRRALQLAETMTLELRDSRDRIKADQERMKVILQNAYDAFIAVDTHGRVTDWNAQATRTFGWSEQEALGRDLAELLIPQEQRARHRAGFARFAGSGTGQLLGNPTEMQALHRDGRLVPVELAVAALPTPQGFGATAFLRDISARKEAEAREEQRQQRLDEARRLLQRAQKLEAVGKLTGGVAHDFNNILHIISANVQLMRRSGAGSEKRLQGILDAVERGARLSAQLLAFARRQPLHPSAVNVAQLLERMDSLLHRAAGEAVAIDKASPGDLWEALVDPSQLENVILNLVINARDAMGGKGRVTIALDNVTLDASAAFDDPELEPGQYVMVAVSDTGHGMPPEVIEHAFEPFFTTKPEGKGTGLGLSMAHGFVRQSGGHIRLSSVAGEGTTVTLYLPRCASRVPDAAPAPDEVAGS